MSIPQPKLANRFDVKFEGMLPSDSKFDPVKASTLLKQLSGQVATVALPTRLFTAVTRQVPPAGEGFVAVNHEGDLTLCFHDDTGNIVSAGVELLSILHSLKIVVSLLDGDLNALETYRFDGLLVKKLQVSPLDCSSKTWIEKSLTVGANYMHIKTGE